MEDAPEWVGGAATRPRGGRDTRRGHTQAQASLLRYCPMSLDSLYPPLPRKRRAALAASGPVFSLMGRHETLLHVSFCLKTASRGHCHWLRRTDPVGSTIARPGQSPPGTLGPPWGRSVSCAQITGCDELSAGATRAAKSPPKQESGDAPRGGRKTALPGGGGRGRPLPWLCARPSQVPSRAPQGRRRRQVGPHEQVGSQRQDPRALETATVHKPLPTLLLRARLPAPRRERQEGPAAGVWRAPIYHFGREQLTASRGSSSWTPGRQAGSAAHPPWGAERPAPRKAGRSSEHGPRAMTREPLSLKGRKGGWMSQDGDTKGNKKNK